MSFRTAYAIENEQWLMERESAMRMLDLWDKVKSGEVQWDYQATKEGEAQSTGLQLLQKVFDKECLTVAPETSWGMKNFAGFEGSQIAVIPVMGPLMKNDYCGSLGTKSLAALTDMAGATESVQAIVYLHDSPGGSTNGTEVFAEAIKRSPKLTISLVEGCMCSADYWVGCAADKIYATSKTDMIGSIGTMCAFYDNTKALESKGIVLREYYATESTEKNGPEREARAGNGKRLIEEQLDPLNNVFMQTVKANRKGKLNANDEKILKGKVYNAEAAVEAGLIDGIKSFNEVIDGIMKKAEKKAAPYSSGTTIINNNTNNNTMSAVVTVESIKKDNPEVYNAIFQEGVNEERARVGAWREFESIDPEAVNKGITEGTPMTTNVIAKMSAVAMKKNTAEAVKADNPATVETPSTTATVDAEKKNFDEAVNAVVAGMRK